MDFRDCNIYETNIVLKDDLKGFFVSDSFRLSHAQLLTVISMNSEYQQWDEIEMFDAETNNPSVITIQVNIFCKVVARGVSMTLQMRIAFACFNREFQLTIGFCIATVASVTRPLPLGLSSNPPH